MKFILFTAGLPAKLPVDDFLRRWLEPQVRRPVDVQLVRFENVAHYENDLARKVQLHLTARAGTEVVAGMGLIDFDPLPRVPGEDEDPRPLSRRLSVAKGHYEVLANNARFTQHFAVPDLESWLLSMPATLPHAVAEAVEARSAHPEAVEPAERPAHLLERLYGELTGQRYRRTLDGAYLLSQLDPSIARAKCPKLRALLDELLEKAQAAVLDAAAARRGKNEDQPLLKRILGP